MFLRSNFRTRLLWSFHLPSAFIPCWKHKTVRPDVWKKPEKKEKEIAQKTRKLKRQCNSHRQHRACTIVQIPPVRLWFGITRWRDKYERFKIWGLINRCGGEDCDVNFRLYLEEACKIQSYLKDGQNGVSTDDQPCGESLRATPNPRRDHLQMWRKLIECTRYHMLKSCSISSSRRTYPCALSQAVEAKLVCDLGGVHGILYRN